MQTTTRCLLSRINMFVIVFCIVGSAFAAIPQKINYQGYLTDGSGNPLTDTVSMIFSLYDAETEGTQLWTELQSSVTVTDGVFNVQLGSETPIALDFSATYWLETEVNGEALSPRQALSSVGYAFRAEYANNVDDADADATNELNTSLTLNGTTLELTDAGGTVSQELGGLCDSSVHTRDEIYALIESNCSGDGSGFPAPVAKSGQTISYATGDDGDRERGVAWPDPRFTDNGDGTVTDNLTGLIWLKNANCFGEEDWSTALTDSNDLSDGACGLTDGSSDWRLPHVEELHSLIDRSQHGPALPSVHPFTGIQSSVYWSSTTNAYDTNQAWGVYVHNGVIDYKFDKAGIGNVWPVRGGQ